MAAPGKYWAVVPAAGAGRRMSSAVPKQYLDIDGSTVIEHSLHALLDCPRITAVTVVIAADDDRWPAVAARLRDHPVDSVSGGAERCHSVLRGLEHLMASAQASDWVLVHDAARPCVRTTDIETLIDTLGDDRIGGLLGVPVADTMKQVDATGQVEHTVPREGLWHALTPQMFRLGELHAALERAVRDDRLVTDEAAAMELAGYRPRMVQGQRDNIKITRPADLELAAFYLQTRSAE